MMTPVPPVLVLPMVMPSMMASLATSMVSQSSVTAVLDGNLQQSRLHGLSDDR